MKKPKHAIATVDGIQIIESHGPWDTKSGGKLTVLFGLPLEPLQKQYLQYENEELETIPGDIRGLRTYMVRGLSKGIIGANEWHKVRNELVYALEGSVRWTCEDVYGRTKEFVLNGGQAVWTPPYILHTYQALTAGSGLFVLANTLFIPDDPRTHDTYSADSFRKLQSKFNH